MVALATAVPADSSPVAPPLRHPVALPLFLAAAILLAPLLWVGLVIVIAFDADKEACDVA